MWIGKISINISLFFYLILFVPQLLLNIKRKNTQGLSLLTQGMLCFGYLSDLMYGFGCHMQWQYKMVTLVGLLCLFIQHIQFYQYGLNQPAEKKVYLQISGLIFVWLSCMTAIICFLHPDRMFYDDMGLFAVMCWTLCLFPQIIKNHINQSTVGLSEHFVIFSLIVKICDIISAWFLHWDYPSKIGSIIFFIGSAILLWQVIYYARKIKKPSMVAYC